MTRHSSGQSSSCFGPITLTYSDSFAALFSIKWLIDPSRKKAARRIAIALGIALFFCAAGLTLVAGRGSRLAPSVSLASLTFDTNGAATAILSIKNRSDTTIFRMSYARIEGEFGPRQMINLSGPPSVTTVPGGEDSVIIPLPAAAKGKITVYIFGAFKASAFQEVAETFGEMLEKVNLQPDRLKNFYDPSANTWETNCSIEIERPIRSNL